MYKINLQGTYTSNGYNNDIPFWAGDTSAINISNTFGQSNGIDVYLFSEVMEASNNALADECFPDKVINKFISWNDTETHQIYLRDLNPGNTYTFKILAATTNSGTNRGTQIWTTEENRDTVFAANNICNMAELTDLVSNANGDLVININTIDNDVPRAYINSIEIVEYIEDDNTNIVNKQSKELIIFPNPVSDYLFIEAETVPSDITVYTCDGRMVKHFENSNNVNTSDLKSGIYIISVYMQGTVATKKIIKE